MTIGNRRRGRVSWGRGSNGGRAPGTNVSGRGYAIGYPRGFSNTHGYRYPGYGYGYSNFGYPYHDGFPAVAPRFSSRR